MRRLLRVSGAVLAALLIGACLKDHPLILPENGYDPAHSLRQDSLERFDYVEILLVDPDDTTRAIRIFSGRLPSVDSLDPQVGGDGRTLVYLVRGWRTDRGQCFTEQVTREGVVTFLLDTCERRDTVPVVPDTKDPVPVRPRFDSPYFILGTQDTSFGVGVKAFTGPGSAILRVVSWFAGDMRDTWVGKSWIEGLPVVLPPERDTMVTLTPKVAAMPPGIYFAWLEVSSPFGTDTMTVQLNVPPPPAGLLIGRVVAFRDSQPQAGWTVRLDGDSIAQVTGVEGAFNFGLQTPGRHILYLSGEGRIGRTDTVDLADKDSLPRVIVAPPVGAFRALTLSWQRTLGSVAVAAGHGLVSSSEYDAAGEVAVFPLNNLSPSLTRFPKQGNSEEDPAGEFFEAGEMVVDSGALYIAYPENDRLGKVEDWRGAARARNVALPFQPHGLLREGDALLVLGRNTQGTMVLGELDAATLVVRRLDTLAGHSWDATLALDRGPRLVSAGGGWYAVDGNMPSALGRLLRIDKASRKVTWVELPDAGASDVAAWDGLLYVTISAPSARNVHVYDGNLKPVGTVAVDGPAHRLVFADRGALAGLGFLAVDGDAVLVLRPGEDEPVGLLKLGGSLRGARSLTVDGAGRILATDKDKIFIAEF